MDFLLGVEIDNGRIAWILDSVKPSAATVRLTTVSDNQQKAILSFYIKQSGKKELLFAETLTSLPPMPAGGPSIEVFPRISGKSFNYEIFVNGRLVRRSTHDLSRYMRNRKPLIIGAAAVALLALIILLFFLLKPLFSTAPAMERELQPSPVAADIREEKKPEPEALPEQTKPARPAPEPGKPAAETAAPAAESESEEADTENEPSAPPESVTVMVESEISDRHSVYFEPDSPGLTPKAVSELRDFINELPHRGDFSEGDFRMEVRGHCAKYGTEEGRAELSRERAVNVYNFLKSEWGIEADSVVTGVGASEPVTLRRDEQYLNRRVDINIAGNIKKEQKSE